MEQNQRNRVRGTRDRSSDLRMNTFDRARAREEMDQAIRLAELTLAAFARIRQSLRSAGHAMTLAYGRYWS